MGLMNDIFGGDKGEALGLLGAYMMAGNAPAGFQAATQHLAGAEDRRLKGLLAQMQLENMRSEIDDRKMSREQKAALMKQTQDLLNAPANYEPGQLGSGSFGSVNAMHGQSDMPAPRAGGLAAAPFEKVVALSAAGGPNLTDAWKYIQTGAEEKPGTFRLMPDGSRRFVPNIETGRDFRDGRIVPILGHNDFLSQQTLATEGVKALLDSAKTVNLRETANGTQIPVSSLDENPTLRALLGSRMPTQQGGHPQHPPAPSVAPQPGMRGNFQGSPEQISAAIAGITDPQERANAQSAFDEQMRRTGGTLPASTFTGYGMTNEQKTAAEAAKVRAVEQAKADVKPTEQRKAAMDSALNMYNVVTKALEHPGRETSTGLSGVIDPRNYMPGTNAKDFRVLLDQIKGSAFLQAFESLKGGGQITETEGKKATDAIARLQTAQSDGEFKVALQDFQSIIGGAIARMGGQLPGRQQSGAVGPAVGSVENGYRFNGGNPADSKNWTRL